MTSCQKFGCAVPASTFLIHMRSYSLDACKTKVVDHSTMRGSNTSSNASESETNILLMLEVESICHHANPML